MNAKQIRPEQHIAGLVSVVIPCYNYAHFLPEAVLSVISQTYTCWEIIIVDDGSPDNTSSVANAIKDKYPHLAIHLVRRTNGGMSAARNTGIAQARGEYILPLDADDLLAPTFLQKTVTLLEQAPEIGIAYTDVRLFGLQDEIWHVGRFSLEDLKRNNRIVVQSLFRKAAWEECNGFNEVMRLGYEDWDFWLRLAERGWKWQGIPEPLALYRKHGTSVHEVTFGKRLALIANIILEHPQLYGPSLVRLADDIRRVVGQPLDRLRLDAEMSRIDARHPPSIRERMTHASYEFVMGHLFKLLSALPLYHMLWLRKQWLVIRQGLRQVQHRGQLM